MNSNNLKKKLITTVLSLSTIFGIVVAATTQDPSDLIKDKALADRNTISINNNDENKNTGQAIINKIPKGIKIVMLLPMWLIGTFVLKLLNKIVRLIGMPFIAFLVSTLFTFFVLLIIVVLFVKLLFPNMKLKDILTKRMLIYLLICSLLMTASDYIMLAMFDDYDNIRKIFKFIIGFIILILGLLNFIKKKINEPKIIYGEI